VAVGVAFGTGEIAAFVTLSEFIDTEHRNYFLGSMNATWGLAAFLTAVLYEIFGDWQILVAFIIAYSIMTVIPVFFIDDSPHYHATIKENFRKAKMVLDRVADVNGTLRFEGVLDCEAAFH
jgi:MFS family permease